MDDPANDGTTRGRVVGLVALIVLVTVTIGAFLMVWRLLTG